MLLRRVLFLALLACVPSLAAQKPARTSAVSVLSAPSVQSGEYPGLETGKMWQFDVPPLEYWKKRYHFEPSAQWRQSTASAPRRAASSSESARDPSFPARAHCGQVTPETVSGHPLWAKKAVRR